MRHRRITGAGATLALAAALASCSPVESLDEEESSSAGESATESAPASDEPTGTEDESTEAGTDEGPTGGTEEETTATGPFEPTEEPTTTDAPTEGADEGTDGEDTDGEAPAGDDGTVTVEHDAGTVSYALPSGWNDLSFAYEGHPTIVMGAAPLETAANGSQVTLTAIEGGAGSFDAYRQAIDAQRPDGADLVDADPLTVEGSAVQGLRVEMETPQGAFVQYTFPIFEDGYQWELQFAMDAGDEDADYPQMRQVAESIVIE